MAVKVHSGTVLGDEFAAMLKKRPRMHFDNHLDPVSRTTSKVARQSESKFVPQYALLTYGNMPVQPRFRVKFLLKFKYGNVVRLAFQKKFYSKTRMDGHITIREKSVYSFTVQRFDLTSNGPYVPSIAESNILGVRVIESLPLLQFATSGSE